MSTTVDQGGAAWSFDAEVHARVRAYVVAATQSGNARMIVDNDELKRASLKLEAAALRYAADVIEQRLQRGPQPPVVPKGST